MSQETPASQTEAQIKTKRRISPFWLLPFIALMIAGWLIWGSYEDRGNTVTIDFMSADGIVLAVPCSLSGRRSGHGAGHQPQQRPA